MKKLFVILLFAPKILTAQNLNYHFAHTLETNAPSDSIWRIWVDVGNWKQWDNGIKDASLLGEFAVGAKGTLIPDKGPRSIFRITAVDWNRTYTFHTRIPFGWLVVTRSLTVQGARTLFTHEVRFTGPLKRLMGASMGKRYRSMLPVAMVNIRRIAEGHSE